MELLLIYLWLKLDTFLATSFIAAFVLALLVMFPFSMWHDAVGGAWDFKKKDGTFERKKLTWIHFPPIKLTLCFAVFFAISAVLLPSSKQVAVLVGAHYAFKVAESPEAAKLVTLARLKAGQYLDEAISDATPKAKDAAPKK